MGQVVRFTEAYFQYFQFLDVFYKILVEIRHVSSVK